MRHPTPVMIMVAPTGSKVLKKDNPHVPLSPAEIANDVVRCAQAGASIAHLHARDVMGRPTQDSGVFKEIVDRIRERSDIVLQISLGSPGFSVEEAVAPLVLDPEMIAFPLRSFSTHGAGSIPGDVRDMASAVNAIATIPELDIVDFESRKGVDVVLQSGLIGSQVAFGVNVQNPETMRVGSERLLSLTGGLPEGSPWWVMKGGACMRGLAALTLELGGHLRVGLEDLVVDFDGTSPAESNVLLVESAVRVCASLDRPIATPADVRDFFSIPCPENSMVQGQSLTHKAG
ncbi:3-keto-5-aminohexanoate cleavage protein [Micrococcaceae bacterium Sec5.1]